VPWKARPWDSRESMTAYSCDESPWARGPSNGVHGVLWARDAKQQHPKEADSVQKQPARESAHVYLHSAHVQTTGR
jgi:hypothetical protein